VAEVIIRSDLRAEWREKKINVPFRLRAKAGLLFPFEASSSLVIPLIPFLMILGDTGAVVAVAAESADGQKPA
jgi:hypothetical protein